MYNAGRRYVFNKHCLLYWKKNKTVDEQKKIKQLRAVRADIHVQHSIYNKINNSRD